MDADNRSESEYIDYGGFYGIWVGASKSEDEAKAKLSEVKSDYLINSTPSLRFPVEGFVLSKAS